MKVSSVLFLLWENSCWNNPFHFYGSLMLDKLTDYLSLLPPKKWSSLLVSVLGQCSKTSSQFGTANRWISKGGWNTPKYQLRLSQASKSGRVPTDFQKSSERIKIPAEGQVANCPRSLAWEKIPLRQVLIITMLEPDLAHHYQHSTSSKLCQKIYFSPQESKFFQLAKWIQFIQPKKSQLNWIMKKD